MTLERRHVDMAFGTLRYNGLEAHNGMTMRECATHPCLRASLAAQLRIARCVAGSYRAPHAMAVYSYRGATQGKPIN